MASIRWIWPGPMTRFFTAAFAMLLFIAPSAHADTLTLRDAIDRALRFAPSLAMATATSDLSEARTREMRAPMMPSISAGSEYYQAPGYDEVITNRGLTSGTARARLHRGRFRTADVAGSRRALRRRGRAARDRRHARADCLRHYGGVLRSDASQARGARDPGQCRPPRPLCRHDRSIAAQRPRDRERHASRCAPCATPPNSRSPMPATIGFAPPRISDR